MSNKIGRFEILSEIAHSDTSSVYKADDTESKQTVALKVVRLATLGEQGPALVKSILDEAETSKVLNSHNIALLYGAGEIEGQLCAAMEYVQGNSVATMLARKEGFSIWDLQDIARQTCQGLDHAHTRKVFHCALEPAKIMVQWDGVVKILGFGVSSTGLYASQTAGTPPQTLHYMSPEQLTGDPVDARSNLFSLGAILYEMVTERRAFDGADAAQVRQAILESTPPAPDQVNRKIHPVLNSVIVKAIAKSPEERYQSGQELVNDLEKCKESATKATAKPAPPKAAAKAPASSAQAPASPKLTRAAAASAGAGTRTAPTQAASSPKMKPMPSMEHAATPGEEMSAVVEEPTAQAPRIAVDPMMDESRQAGKSGKSFSDIDELPPLKEVYVAPPAMAHEQPEPIAPVHAAVTDQEEERPKLRPGEVAKKAVGEIKQTPPHLFIYSIGAAAAIILLVVVGIAYHIHSGESDDDSVPTQSAPAQVAPAPVNPPAKAAPPVQSATPAPAPAPSNVPPEIVTEEPVKAERAAPATSKHSHSKNVARSAKAVEPSIVPGQLNLDSSPEGAQITVDGKKIASLTPFNVADLLPGHHTITISKAGYASETRSVDVTSGSKSVITVQLAATMATVALSSDPAGASVWVDGRDSGRLTPTQISMDKPGSHTFVFKKQGYLDETTAGNVQIGQTLQLAPTLRALGNTDDIKFGGKLKKVFGGSETAGMGSVSIKTQPKGAQIVVNNRVVDKTSPVTFYLNPGNYVIDITLPGFKSIEKVVAVEKNGKLVIDENLDRE